MKHHNSHINQSPPCFSLSPIHPSWPLFTWKVVWSLHIPHKIRFFLCQLIHDCLPIGEILTKRGWKGDLYCPFCKAHLENSVHLFLACNFVRPVRFGSDLGLYMLPPSSISMALLAGFVVYSYNQERSAMSAPFLPPKISTFLWCIWKAKNNCIFQSSISYPWQVLFEAFYLSTSIAKVFFPTQSLVPSIFYTTQPASQSSFFSSKGPKLSS